MTANFSHRHLAEIVKLCPDNIETCFLIDDILVRKGENEIDRRIVLKTLQFDPLHKKAQKLLYAIGDKHADMNERYA